MPSLRVLIPSIELANVAFEPASKSEPQTMAIPLFLHQLDVLLWADEVLMAEKAFQNAHLSSYFSSDVDKECARLLLDQLKKEGILVTFDPCEKLPEMTQAAIAQLVARDEAVHGHPMPEPDADGKVDFMTLDLGGVVTCPVQLAAVYAALAIGELYGAIPLFDPGQQAMWSAQVAHADQDASILRTLSFLLPSLVPEDNYKIFCKPELAEGCGNRPECQGAARANTMKMADDVLRLRDEPCVKDICLAVRKIAGELDGPVETRRLIRAAYRDVTRSQRTVVEKFASSPFAARWTSTSLFATGVAVGLFGVLTGHSFIGSLGGAGTQSLALLNARARASADRSRRWRTFAQQSIDYDELRKYVDDE